MIQDPNKPRAPGIPAPEFYGAPSPAFYGIDEDAPIPTGLWERAARAIPVRSLDIFPPVRACVDCAHHALRPVAYANHRCARPRGVTHRDLVTGEPRYESRSGDDWDCREQRDDPRGCGPDARYFVDARGPRRPVDQYYDADTGAYVPVEREL